MAITTAKLTGKRCQCGGCEEVFSTEANFNRHRKGEYGKDRHCLSPETVGLVLGETASGTIWKMPGMNADEQPYEHDDNINSAMESDQ